MRVAYCILCHRNNIILRTLVELLSRDNDVYIHVDAKSDIAWFAEYRDRAIFIEEREVISWGSFAMVKATLKLLKMTQNKQYDYISLLSGDDLPIKNDVQIKSILSCANGTEFIGVVKGADIAERLLYEYTEGVYSQRKRFINKLRYRLKLFRKSKLFRNLPQLYKGSQWFTITYQLRNYIVNYVEQHDLYLKAFEKSFAADEVFFQTIACNNKEFKLRINSINENLHDTRMALRYIDWSNGLKVLDEYDYESMKASGCLFARKLNENIDINKFKNYFELE